MATNLCKILPRLYHTQNQITLNRLLSNLSLTLNAASAEKWKNFIIKSSSIAPITRGNFIQIFNNATDFFKLKWEKIQSAQKSIIFEMYTLEPDKVGSTTIKLLTNALKRNVSVTVLVDDFGSNTVNDDHFKKFKDLGGVFIRYNRINILNTVKTVLTLNLKMLNTSYLRNHRKCVVIDEKYVFMGSSNHGEKYVDGSIGGSDLFRDTNCFIEGPAVETFVREFTATLAETDAKGRIRARADFYSGDDCLLDDSDRKRRGFQRTPAKAQQPPPFPAKVYGADSFLQVLFSSRRKRRRQISLCMAAAINSASEYVYVTNPYFLPPLRLYLALQRAAARGVDVRILTTGPSDVWVAKYASHVFFAKLLRRGVKIFELRDRVLHAKTIVADDVYCSVGSFNFDEWSVHRNLEVNVASVSVENAKKIKHHFETDVKNSEELDFGKYENRSLMEKLFCYVCLAITKIPKITEMLQVYRWKKFKKRLN